MSDMETATTINDRELRIGNWLKHDDKFIQVESINGDEKEGINLTINWGYDGSEYLPYHRLEPVPLTPEILEKAGWGLRVYDTPEQQAVYGGTHVFERDDESFVFVRQGDQYILCDHSIARVQPFRYLHQLQNLYFALTGEELEVKL